ncbi:calcineurin-like phosphoesterase family protein [Cytophagaceae bacterium YF14B1]|uniref:Calcineurin-like phosphoesterase family protein n=1 Tax=Xanthocytophaga flava TaxID=3048013 RepID=A0AAE3QW11_9BACT|nr:calcineurin-like phosphoesterase family protein [Xanthocytophaga flavus]MDJ1484520.1 calcineurin-like phosphoesterase family protein [Xanthocytophaga flavus]
MLTKRRSFLKSIGLGGLGLSYVHTLEARSPQLPAGIPTTDVSVVRIKGKVQAEGKGMAGVAVTDGINITTTDAKGNYELLSNASAEFVYISTPRGYEFANQNGVVRFYQPVKVVNGAFQAIFTLTKLTQDDTRHNFIVWADPQMISKEDAELFLQQSVPDTRKLLDSYKQKNNGQLPPFHGVGCGDLVWDRFELFEDYQKGVTATGIPFFQVIGNHDMDLTARTDEHSAKTFKSTFGPTYYSFNRGEIHYVVLDDVFFIGTAKKYIGYLTERQLAWLEQDLALVKAGTTVVVFMHIPANTGDQRRNKAKEEPIGGVVANRKELYRLLQPYKAHIMSGHTHFNEKIVTGDNLVEHVHGTVCGAWWTGPVCFDGTPNGYGVYEVNGSTIEWYYKSVGHEKDHQMRLYPIGASKEKPDHVVVNVWNWDPAWKVEWLEDGKPMGPMTQETAFDPLSVELHEGTAKPAKHKWVEPQLTDHLFFAKPSVAASKIKVQVTDRFKNTYTQEMDVKRS